MTQIRPRLNEDIAAEVRAYAAGWPVSFSDAVNILLRRGLQSRGLPSRDQDATDEELIAEARRIGPAVRAGASDRDRLAGWLLLELADRLDGRAAAQVPELGLA